VAELVFNEPFCGSVAFRNSRLCIPFFRRGPFPFSMQHLLPVAIGHQEMDQHPNAIVFNSNSQPCSSQKEIEIIS